MTITARSKNILNLESKSLKKKRNSKLLLCKSQDFFGDFKQIDLLIVTIETKKKFETLFFRFLKL